MLAVFGSNSWCCTEVSLLLGFFFNFGFHFLGLFRPSNSIFEFLLFFGLFYKTCFDTACPKTDASTPVFVRSLFLAAQNHVGAYARGFMDAAGR